MDPARFKIDSIQWVQFGPQQLCGNAKYLSRPFAKTLSLAILTLTTAIAHALATHHPPLLPGGQPRLELPAKSSVHWYET